MSIATRTGAARDVALRRFEPAAFGAVWKHELTLFKRYWPSTSFSAVVEPTIYLVVFGAGFGTLVGVIGGYKYVEFLGTGVVASGVLFASAFAGMFVTFIRRTFQRSYDAMLSTPVDVHELVAAEASWHAAKAGVYGSAPLLVAMMLGLAPSWGMLLVPFVGFLTGLGFALFGIWMASIVPSINSFDYVISGLLTPLFLVAGTFFPIDQLPAWAQVAALFNPLYHCVELVRDCSFGFHPLADLGHVGALVVFVAIMGFLAHRYMHRRLID